MLSSLRRGDVSFPDSAVRGQTCSFRRSPPVPLPSPPAPSWPSLMKQSDRRGLVNNRLFFQKSTAHSRANIRRSFCLRSSPGQISVSKCRALEFQPTKQLRIRSHNDGGEAHCDCTNAHRQIESPSDEKASRERDGDKGIRGRPNEILNHLSISTP